jgi:hypothetical protein
MVSFALQKILTAHVGSGSWLCKNALERRTDRIDLPSGRDLGRGNSQARAILIDQRKIILPVFELAGFSHSQGPFAIFAVPIEGNTASGSGDHQ